MNLFQNIHSSWIPFIYSLAYEKPMVDFLENLSDISYEPRQEEIFKVFSTPLDKIKVVILGLEPYPRPRTATGLAYATKEGHLQNPNMLTAIKNEIMRSVIPHTVLGKEKVTLLESLKPWKQHVIMQDPKWGTLEHLAEQGVFLFNTALTVETGRAGSHIADWEKFTEMVISYISENKPCIWLLWGKNLLSHSSRITRPFFVEGYDRKTIEEIPIDDKINYIIPGEQPILKTIEECEFANDGFYLANSILKNKSLTKIIW